MLLIKIWISSLICISIWLFILFSLSVVSFLGMMVLLYSKYVNWFRLANSWNIQDIQDIIFVFSNIGT